MFDKGDMDKLGNSGGLLRLKAAAGWLAVSKRTLYRIVADKKLRLVHVRGCSCIEESELQKYVERNKGGKNHD
jgi:excisionase family DNA binding protein